MLKKNLAPRPNTNTVGITQSINHQLKLSSISKLSKISSAFNQQQAQHNHRHYDNPNENDKESLDNKNDDNDDSHDLIIQSQISDDAIETVALEYDMGITTKETKLCSCGTHRCCKRPTEEIGDGLEDKPSNEELLSVAFISFLTFTICQAVAAYFANSQAMMGDSMAMGVDAFTYDGFNRLMAERMKHKIHVSIPCLNIMNTLNIPQMQIQHDERWNQRAKRKQTLVLELVPPIISAPPPLQYESSLLIQWTRKKQKQNQNQSTN